MTSQKGLTKGRKQLFAKEPQHKNKWLNNRRSENNLVESASDAYKKP